MKNLQKYVCTIFLFMAVIAGCKQTTPLPESANPQNPDNNGGGGVTATFSLTDDNGVCELEKNADTYSATVKTKKALLKVHEKPLGAKVLIDGVDAGRTKSFTFTENGETQTTSVTVTHNGSVKRYTVNVRYYKGAIKTLTVTDENNKKVPILSSGDTAYAASVGTKKAKVEVETVEAADTVKIAGEETRMKEVEFNLPDEKAKTLEVVVTHNGKDETYKVKLHYSDPNLTPKEPILTNLVLKNADDSTSISFSPEFQPYNTLYTARVP